MSTRARILIARQRQPSSVTSGLLMLFVIGCGSSGTRGHTPPPSPPIDNPTCPLLVPETTLTVEDAAGPSFVFITTGDVEEVRTRGRALAEMHNDREGPHGAFELVITGVSSAVAANIDGGVRVTFRPADPNDAGKLGDELRMRGSHLAGARGSCAM